MAIKEIIRMGHPTLKQVAAPISFAELKTTEFQQLLIDLYDTMKAEGGIGIAAPQINISKQVALIEIPKDSPRYGKLSGSPLFTIINPIILPLTQEEQSFFEGCLSVPGLRGKVTRPKKVQIDFINAEGNSESIIVEDFLATVFQHELDHLNGKLYVERMSDLSQLTYLDEFDLYHKNKL